MTDKIHQGIVLRYQPMGSKITIFDKDQGKIDGFVRSTQRSFMHGALIFYRREQYRDRYYIYFHDQIALPAPWVIEEFLFFHFLLELGLFFLPSESPDQHIFDIYMHMYRAIPAVDLFSKKLFVCRFFLFAGIYVEHDLTQNISFLNLISGPIDTMLGTRCEAQLHKKVVDWIHECMGAHMQGHRLKTAHFLLMMDNT